MNTTNNSIRQIKLPDELLTRLRTRKMRKGYLVLDDRAVFDAACLLGIKPTGGTWWNETLYALDVCDPNWRGYPAPKINPNINKVLAHKSARDAA